MDLLKAIEKVAEILKSSDISKIEVKDGSSTIFMTKNNKYTTSVESIPITNSINPDNLKQLKEKEKQKISGEEIKSPMVGTFYSAPSPDTESYVKEGQNVKKGDVLCIIEAMKIMNKIEVEKDGKIIKIIAKDGDSIQFDQPLFIID